MNFYLFVLLGAAAVLAAPKCPDGYTRSPKYYKAKAGKAKTFGVASCKTSCEEVDNCAGFTFKPGKCKKKKGKKTCAKGHCTLLKRAKKMRKCKAKKTACCIPAVSPAPPPQPPPPPAIWYVSRQGVGSCQDSSMPGRGAVGGEAGSLMPGTNHCHGPAYSHTCTSGTYGHPDALGKEGWRITCGDNSCADKSKWYFKCGDVSAQGLNLPACIGSGTEGGITNVPCYHASAWP